MIHAVLVFNTDGKPRLSKFYSQPSFSASLKGKGNRGTSQDPEALLVSSSSPSNIKHEFLKTIYNLVNYHQHYHHIKVASGASSTPITASNSKTNFINLDQSILCLINQNKIVNDSLKFFKIYKDYLNLNLCLVYRNYATLSFVFLIDQSESQLGILDLIQVFVESLDKCFKNVCELDLIFNYDKLDLLLNQIIIGGIVLDTSVESIISNYQSHLNALKNSSSSSNPASIFNNFSGLST